MLKAVIRVLILGTIVIAIAWGISWLMQNGGEIPMQIRGKEYRPTMVAIVLAIVAGLFLFLLFI